MMAGTPSEELSARVERGIHIDDDHSGSIDMQHHNFQFTGQPGTWRKPRSTVVEFAAAAFKNARDLLTSAQAVLYTQQWPASSSFAVQGSALSPRTGRCTCSHRWLSGLVRVVEAQDAALGHDIFAFHNNLKSPTTGAHR